MSLGAPVRRWRRTQRAAAVRRLGRSCRELCPSILRPSKLLALLLSLTNTVRSLRRIPTRVASTRGRDRHPTGHFQQEKHWQANTLQAQHQICVVNRFGERRPRRTLPGLLPPGSVLGPTSITFENNEKIRSQPDREKLFTGASGGGNATAGEPSL